MIRNALNKILSSLNINVDEASNGLEALKRSSLKIYDLIITDIDMPNMDGFKLCEELKKNPMTEFIPVVILSSYDKETDIEMGFQVGAAAYISKENIQTQVQPVIKELLRKSIFFKDKKVLVVDDSEIIKNIVKDGLIKAGFNVITVNSGKKALEFLWKDKIDLVISDLEMPEMDGMELCKAMHTINELKSIPFILMYSKEYNISMRRMIQLGASACIIKPFEIDQLIVLVEKILSDQFMLLLKEKERLELEQKYMLASMTSLIQALEARDPCTRGHSENVARMVKDMAKSINADISELENLEIAAKLHDIGKIGIPDNVLLKPGKLTDEEYKIIKQHPSIGAEIIKPVSSFANAIPVVLNHHERFDGKGYPEGLKGSKIPFWARLTSVVDVYDALTSNRAYRVAMPRDKALQIIEDSKGTQLCPESVDLFFKYISG